MHENKTKQVATRLFKLQKVRSWIFAYIISAVPCIFFIADIINDPANSEVSWIFLAIINFLLYPISDIFLQIIASPNGIFAPLKDQFFKEMFNNGFGEGVLNSAYVIGKKLLAVAIVWIFSIVIAPIGLVYLTSKISKSIS